MRGVPGQSSSCVQRGGLWGLFGKTWGCFWDADDSSWDARGELERSWSDLGASWGNLEPSEGDLAAFLEDLGAIWGAQEGFVPGWGRRCSRRARPPLETFCRKFLHSQMENELVSQRRSPEWTYNTPAALGAADLERALRETAAP